jgi:hypothetical protein
MKKSNLSFILIVGVGVVLLVLLSVQNRTLGKALLVASQDALLCEEWRQFAEAKNIVLESNVILSEQSTGKRIDGNILLTDTKNKTQTTAEVFAGKTPCLVFRYSYAGGCSRLVSTQLLSIWNA